MLPSPEPNFYASGQRPIVVSLNPVVGVKRKLSSVGVIDPFGGQCGWPVTGTATCGKVHYILVDLSIRKLADWT